MKKGLSLFLALVMLLSACTGVALSTSAKSAADVISVSGDTAYKAAAKDKVTKKQRNGFYKNAAFVGSSIGLGQKYYFDRQGKNYLGKPTMLVRGCYSFHNDKKKLSKWMVRYKGKPMQARVAIKKCKCKRVFIAMGTNDFRGNADVVYKDYVEYLKGIRKMNPKVVIFIESTTSVTKSKQGKYLNSRNIKKLNKKMKAYCKKQKDMYFIDVSSKMNDKNGHLKRKYASDNYCHLTDAAYKLWTQEMIKFTDKLILQERAAKKAVTAAEKSKTQKSVDNASALVSKLEKSTVKDGLTKRIKKIEIPKPETTSESTSETTTDGATE